MHHMPRTLLLKTYMTHGGDVRLSSMLDVQNGCKTPSSNSEIMVKIDEKTPDHKSDNHKSSSPSMKINEEISVPHQDHRRTSMPISLANQKVRKIKTNNDLNVWNKKQSLTPNKQKPHHQALKRNDRKRPVSSKPLAHGSLFVSRAQRTAEMNNMTQLDHTVPEDTK